MSRFPKVKNDVNIKDFLRLTLLRYKDIEAYYMLSETDLVTRGNFISSSSESVVYQKKNMEYLLANRQNAWDGTIDLLNKLFPKRESKETYNLDNNYKRIMMVNSFDLYFYDDMVGRLYHKDLSRLFVEDDEQVAISKLKEMINRDEKSVEEYLRSRNMGRLATQNALIREFHLLMELYKMRRNIINQSSLVWLMNNEAAKEAVDYGVVEEKEEYKNIIHELLTKLMDDYAIEIGGLLLLHVKEYQRKGASELLLSRKEYIELAIWCQRTYFSKFGEENWNLNYALELSDIKISKANKLIVIDEAKMELKAFMEMHAEYFAKMIVYANVSRNPAPKTITFSFIEKFNPNHFFPVGGFDFKDWVDGSIKDEDTRFVVNRLYKEYKDGQYLSIPNMTGNDSIEGFDMFASVIREYDANKLDKEVLDYLKENISTDLKSIAFALVQDNESIRASIKRLADRGMIESRLTSMKDKMDSFEVDDFVMLAKEKFQKVADSLFYTNNVFRILEIDDAGITPKYKLEGIDNWYEQDEVLAIPIDGVHDKDIYFDPVIMAPYVAPGQPVPVHHTDYSYFMDRFSRCTYKDKTYVELVKTANCQFVHEVQHYMKKKSGGKDLKINHQINYNRI